MIDYQPNKVTLTCEDAVKFAEYQLQEAVEEIQASIKPEIVARMARIAKGEKIADLSEEIDRTRRGVNLLVRALNAIDVVCRRKDK